MIARRQGFALVAAIWILAILTVITLSFGKRAVMDRRAAAYSLDRTQALYLARGAVVRGMVELRSKAAINALTGRRGQTSFDQRWFKPADLIHEEPIFRLSGARDLEGETCTFTITDEESRISINTAPEALLKGIDFLDFRAVNAILRRRETEDVDYLTPFLSVAELRSLDGMDEDLWRGDGKRPGLRDLVTVWGDGRLNVNTASAEALACVPDVSDELAAEIVARRAGLDGIEGTADDVSYPRMNDLIGALQVTGSESEALRIFCKTDSSYFTIVGFATQRQGKIRAQCRAAVRVNEEGVVQLLDWREDPLGS